MTMHVAEAAEILGVDPEQTEDSIRQVRCDAQFDRRFIWHTVSGGGQAYKKLALRYHPDKCTELSKDDATAKFQTIATAAKARFLPFFTSVAAHCLNRKPPTWSQLWNIRVCCERPDFARVRFDRSFLSVQADVSGAVRREAP